MKQILIVPALTAVLLTSIGQVFAVDQRWIYGSQLMTYEEVIEHRVALRNARTDQAREQIRKEHHAQMKARAKAQGMTLPEKPSVGDGGKSLGADQGR